MPNAQQCIGKKRGGPANIDSSLSVLVWGWASPIYLLVNLQFFILNLSSLAGQDQQQIPRTSPMQNVGGNLIWTLQITINLNYFIPFKL